MTASTLRKLKRSLGTWLTLGLMAAACGPKAENLGDSTLDDGVEETALSQAQTDAELLRRSPPSSLVVHPFFSSSMVLQRSDDQLAIFGWAPVGTQISVTLDNGQPKTDTAAGSVGSWRVVLGAQKAGGPHTVKITSSAGNKTFVDVQMGDVWLIGGQSNSTRTFGNLVDDKAHLNSFWRSQAQAIIDRGCQTLSRNIRFARVTLASATQPLSSPRMTFFWQGCNANTVGAISAMGYIMARDLNANLAVPMGIVQNGYGGTSILSWVAGGKRKPGGNVPEPSGAYNAMTAPLAGIRFKGVVWYQGETDVGDIGVDDYENLLTGMVAQWRAGLKAPNLPFIIVQLTGYGYFTDKTTRAANDIRSAQARVASRVAKSSLVVTLDIGDRAYIHPPNKFDVGHRTAQAAMGLCYGSSAATSQPPRPSKATRKADGNVLLSFSNSGQGIKLAHKTDLLPPASLGRSYTAAGFEALLSDSKWYGATATLGDNATTLTLVPSKKGRIVAVRYNARNFPVPMGALYGKNNLPVGPFYQTVSSS